MITNDQELREKIHGFLRRKEAKFPDLADPVSRDKALKDSFRRHDVR